jgi:glycosyltransferase involved in cell wall biosynthesis
VKIAFVTDWLTNIGGGEKVLKAISDLFPNAPIFTTVTDYKNTPLFQGRNIQTSFLQKIPYFHKKHQILLPFLPLAIESLDVSEYDVVVSFSSSVAKSVLTHPGQKHICYIHSPMRYAWEPFFDKRFHKVPKVFMPLVDSLLYRLRLWDKASCNRPDLYIANSSLTQQRVKKYYQCDSLVLYPPVNKECFYISKKKKDYYLAVGRMVVYKKFDLLIDAFKQMPDKELIVLGDGPEKKTLMQSAQGTKNIQFLSSQNDDELKQLYSEARAFLLPQKEDAGIVQLEAMASGTPVIAFKEGGALDVLQEDINGVFFKEQTPKSLIQAIGVFEKKNWNSDKIRLSIADYDIKKFQNNFMKIIETTELNKP